VRRVLSVCERRLTHRHVSRETCLCARETCLTTYLCARECEMYLEGLVCVQDMSLCLCARETCLSVCVLVRHVSHAQTCLAHRPVSQDTSCTPSHTNISCTRTSLPRYMSHETPHLLLPRTQTCLARTLSHTDICRAMHVARDPSSPAPSHTDMSRAHSLAHRHLSRDACCTRPLISCPLAHRQVSASLLLSLSLPLTLSLVLSFLPHAATFLDGYCSTVQDLLDWFEVDLGFTKLYLFR